MLQRVYVKARPADTMLPEGLEAKSAEGRRAGARIDFGFDGGYAERWNSDPFSPADSRWRAFFFF